MAVEAMSKDAREVMEIFRWAWAEVLPHWRNIEYDINAYDNILDKANNPTFSEAPVPFFMMAVDRALPFAFEYLFPRNRFLELIPRSENVTPEQREMAERKLMYTLRHKMDLQAQGLLTIKDSYKCGVGYGIVEPGYVTPQHEILYEYLQEGRTVSSEVLLENGQPILSERYRYVAPGQIIPLPDGSTPENTSGFFFIDFKNEDDFRDDYKREKDLPKEDRMLVGDPEKIIHETRSFGLNANVGSVENVIARLGADQARERNVGIQNIPVMVPIIKYYTPRRHIFIAGGRRVIYDLKADGFQTLRNPLVKASPYPDSNRWFTNGVATPARDIMAASSVYINAFADIMMEILKPQRLLNMRLLGGKIPDRGAYADIPVYDQGTDKAVQYLEGPRINDGMFAFEGRLQNIIDMITGQPQEFAGKGAAGLVRGGGGALASLMEDTEIRKRLAVMILETGWETATIEKTLLLSQSLIPEGGETFSFEDFEDEAGRNRRVTKFLTATREDLRHAYTVEINLETRLRNINADTSMRQAWLNILNGDPYTDQSELREWAMGDEGLSRRLFFSREKMRKTQEQQDALANQERVAGIAKAGGTPSTDLQEAVAGGVSQAGGLQ